MSDFTMPKNTFSMKNALKSVSVLADAGVLHGAGDGPRTPPRCLDGVRKKFQMTNSTMPNNISLMKYAPKSVPGLADVGVPHGDGDDPITPAPGSGSKKHTHHVDQHKKLNKIGG